MGGWNIIPEATCRWCGKKFVPAPYHALKDTYGVYCKPTCYLHGAELTAPKKKKVLAICGYEVKRFKSAREAAERFGSDPKVIRKACRNGERHKGYIWTYEE